jgi:hypothetical protein
MLIALFTLTIEKKLIWEKSSQELFLNGEIFLQEKKIKK